MKDVWVLDINEDTFNALKGDFNRILQKFTHKITSEFRTKEEASGLLGTGEQELIWDPNLMKYVMRPIFDGQGDLFEDANASEDYTGVRRISETNTENAEFREA